MLKSPYGLFCCFVFAAVKCNVKVKRTSVGAVELNQKNGETHISTHLRSYATGDHLTSVSVNSFKSNPLSFLIAK